MVTPSRSGLLRAQIRAIENGRMTSRPFLIPTDRATAATLVFSAERGLVTIVSSGSTLSGGALRPPRSVGRSRSCVLGRDLPRTIARQELS